MRLRYFMAGALAFVLCGFGIPGPQGSGGGSFTGGTLTSDLDMGDNDILGANVIQPTSGQTLVLNDEGGDSALSVTTAGNVSVANQLQLTSTASSLSLGDNKQLILGSGTDARFRWATSHTQDALELVSSGHTILMSAGNLGSGLGLSATSDPAWVLTSATSWGSDTTEWASLSVATGGDFNISTGNSAHTINFNATPNFTTTAASDTTTPTLIALPTGGTAAQAGWVAIEVNGATAWVPYWQ